MRGVAGSVGLSEEQRRSCEDLRGRIAHDSGLLDWDVVFI